MQKKYENFQSLSDIELITLFKKDNNQQIINCIFNRYNNFLISKANSLNKKNLYFDDFVQEGKIGLFKAVLQFSEDKGDSFSSFATVCAFREMLKFFNKISKQDNSLYLTDDEISNLSGIVSLEDIVIGNDEAEKIRKIIDVNLSSFEKKVLESYFLNNSYSEIAKLIDCDIKSVDNALTRIKRKLANSINKEK